MIALIVLVIFILVFLLIKRFLDRYGKYIPSSLLVMFIKQVRDIEESGNGRIVYKKVGDYDVMILIMDGKAIEAISMDMVNDKIYSGVVKDNKPGYGNLLVPIRVPFYSVSNDELIELENKLVGEVMEIIVKYKN
jgi:hypothetical protein